MDQLTVSYEKIGHSSEIITFICLVCMHSVCGWSNNVIVMFLEVNQQGAMLIISVPLCRLCACSLSDSRFRADGRIQCCRPHTCSSAHVLLFTSPIRLFYPAHIFHLNEHCFPLVNTEYDQWFLQLELTHFPTTTPSQPTVYVRLFHKI